MTILLLVGSISYVLKCMCSFSVHLRFAEVKLRFDTNVESTSRLDRSKIKRLNSNHRKKLRINLNFNKDLRHLCIIVNVEIVYGKIRKVQCMVYPLYFHPIFLRKRLLILISIAIHFT